MPKRHELAVSVGGATLLLLVVATLGLLGGVAVYGEVLGWVAGKTSILVGTSIHFNGDLIVVVRDGASSVQRPLELHPSFSYSAISLLFGLVVATPGRRWQQRLVLAFMTLLGILGAQVVLLTGFSLLDTGTDSLLAASMAIYSAWWSMGPFLFAAWWFWMHWFPSMMRYGQRRVKQ